MKMKRILALLLSVLLLLAGCGTAVDTTAIPDSDVSPDATEAPITEAPETETPVKIERTDFAIKVKDDTYVLNADGNGSQADKNFGSEALMDVKSTGTNLTRFGYVKFDISDLAGNNDFTCIELDLSVIWRQVDTATTEFATVEIYGCDTTWDESSLTFNTQPNVHGLVASINDLTSQVVTRSFPVTAYVKSALENGATEVAFMVKENTEGFPTRIHFHTKEGGENAATLSVYHGTKTDTTTYTGSESFGEATVSKNGLDAIVGDMIYKTSSERLEVIEDTYIEAGTSADTNFGAAEHLDFKAMPGIENNYYRITLLKFDISNLKNDDFACAEIVLNCTVMENENIPTPLNVYGCFPTDWDEGTVTYNTRPEREKLVISTTVYGIGSVVIDVTDYVKSAQKAGMSQISFWFEGSTDVVRRLNFASKESEHGAAYLVVGNGSGKLTTDLKYNGVNPWENAMELVSEWINRWEKIKLGGDTNVETIVKDNAEYTLTVGATRTPDGAKTKYTNYPTRNVSTLKGYTASTAETEKYDIYGGLMDESMRQEATGFFYTKKVGDRWWTFDPLGYPFYRTAVVAITIGSGIQRTSFLEKYGTEAEWAQGTTDRLWELGYNSTGGWSTLAKLIDTDQPLAQTNIFYALKKYCQSNGLDNSKSGNTNLLYGILPVFDPDFVDSTDSTVKAAVKAYYDSPYMYGWMSDNELPAALSMLDNSLYLDTSDMRFSYSYATAWTFVYLKTGKIDITAADITNELRAEYRAMVYDRYFKVITEALERYAPYHQYLGCRFVDGCFKDEYVMRVAGYYCDVISYNYYGVWEPDAELIANQQEWAGKPFIITEWYAKGMDVWEKDNRMTNASGAGWTVKNQDDRGKFYQNYALQLLECKGCVGFDWFQFLDNDPDNLSADESNRNSNKGIYSNYAEEYTVLTKYMDELNNQKYNLVKYFDER